MQAIVVCFIASVAVVYAGVVPATTLVRTPSLDSAVIKSDRIGGNFAYSSLEGHAYAAVSPVVQRVVEPVAVTYTAKQVPLGYAAAPVAQYYPTFGGPSYFPTQPVFGTPVGAPIFGGFPGAVQTPIAGVPSPAPAQPAAPTPVAGTPVDEDTVAVEAA